MIRNIIVTTRSGARHVACLGEVTKGVPTLEDHASQFWSKISFDENGSFHAGNMVFSLRYVESVSFVDE